MSYILDALRRAESERERGNVPTLHTKPVPINGAEDGRDKARTRRWIWVTAALLLLLLILGATLALRWTQTPPPLLSVLPPATKGQVLPPPPAITVPATPPQPEPELRRLQPAPPPQAEPVLPPAPAPAPTAAPLPLKDLPDEIRRQLPALVASGAMYSETPSSRMLIVNGQLLREGDKIAPELVLEQIQLKSAVLVFKGRRFSISY